MNTPYFIFLIRDHGLGLGLHLAAGILALVLLTGAARPANTGVSQPTTTAHVVNR